MDGKRLAEIKARCEAAKPELDLSGKPILSSIVVYQDTPDLVAEVERQAAEIERMRGVLTIMSNPKRYFQQKVGGICFEGPHNLYDTPWGFAERELNGGTP